MDRLLKLLEELNAQHFTGTVKVFFEDGEPQIIERSQAETMNRAPASFQLGAADLGNDIHPTKEENQNAHNSAKRESIAVDF